VTNNSSPERSRIQWSWADLLMDLHYIYGRTLVMESWKPTATRLLVLDIHWWNDIVDEMKDKCADCPT
jgi:hypothetical protein